MDAFVRWPSLMVSASTNIVLNEMGESMVFVRKEKVATQIATFPVWGQNSV